MPDEAFAWMGRIKAVEREYGAIRFGTDRLIVAAKENPSILMGQVGRPDIGTASARLEGTYIIRVFAEFETALQHFIRAFHLRKPKARDATSPAVTREQDSFSVGQVRDWSRYRLPSCVSLFFPPSVPDAKMDEYPGRIVI